MLVIEELRSAEVVDYQTTLVAFINCVILGVSHLQTRVSLRNEFIGELLSWWSELECVICTIDIFVSVDYHVSASTTIDAEILILRFGLDEGPGRSATGR